VRDGIISKGKAVMSKLLLEYVSPVALPALARFSVPEIFREGKITDGMNILMVGEDFAAHLLDKIEDPVPAIGLHLHELRESVSDRPIMTLLGEEVGVEITAGQFWEFLKTAKRTHWYVGYIRGKGGLLRGVHAGWMFEGLHIESGPLNRSHGWGVGNRFLAHGS